MNTEHPANRHFVLTISLLCAALGTGTLFTYLKTARNEFVRSATEHMPATFDLERLKVLSNDVLPHIARHRQSVERLRLSIRGYEKQVRDIEAHQLTAKQEMDVLRASLESAQDSCLYGGKVYSREEVAQDLTRRLDAYEREAGTLSEKRNYLKQLNVLLDKAESAIDALSDRREALLAQHDNLKARLLAADLEATSLPSDEVSLGLTDAEELVKEIEAKIAARMILAPTARGGQIPVEIAPAADVRYDMLFKKSL